MTTSADLPGAMAGVGGTGGSRDVGDRAGPGRPRGRPPATGGADRRPPAGPTSLLAVSRPAAIGSIPVRSRPRPGPRVRAAQGVDATGTAHGRSTRPGRATDPARPRRRKSADLLPIRGRPYCV
jgi:hypothetical protein